MALSERLTRTICFLPLSITLLFFLMFTAYTVVQKRNSVKTQVTSLTENQGRRQEQAAAAGITQIEQFLILRRDQLSDSLKLRLDDRLQVARMMAERVLSQYPNGEPALLREKIVTTLRHLNMSFVGGCYFAISTTGEGLLLPDLSGKEGRVLWNGKREHDHPCIRAMLERAANGTGKELSEWWRPGSEETESGSLCTFGDVIALKQAGLIVGIELYPVESGEALLQQVQPWRLRLPAPQFEQVLVVDERGTIIMDSSGLRTGEKVSTLGCRAGSLPPAWSPTGARRQGSGFFHCGARGELYYGGPLKTRPWTVLGKLEVNREQESLHDRETIIRQHGTITLISTLLGAVLFTLSGGILIRGIAARINRGLSARLMYDGLTGLPGRELFTREVTRCLGSGQSVVVVALDLDDFSKVNERFDHDAGDRLLLQVVERLRRMVDGPERLCRHAADEFLLCFPELCGGGEESCQEEEREGLLYKIDQVKELFRKPFLLDGAVIHLEFTSGSAGGGRDIDAQELVRRAGIALFRARAAHRGSHSCYCALSTLIERERLVVEGLAHAQERGEITLEFQPIVLAGSGLLYGLEAFARWDHPQLGPVKAEEFIPLAEKNGVIQNIGYLLFRNACEEMQQLNVERAQSLILSVNISSPQLFDPRFTRTMIEITDEVKIDRRRIHLEIVENSLTSNVTALKPVVNELCRSGFQLSLDNFGTGASSLSYLNRLPMAGLKIDRRFISQMTASVQSAALVRSIIAIASSTELLVVAEGVETREEYEWLVKERCDLMQGHFFAEPMSLSRLSERIRENGGCFVARREREVSADSDAVPSPSLRTTGDVAAEELCLGPGGLDGIGGLGKGGAVTPSG